MTKKVKNGIIVCGTTAACAALAVLITAQFKKPETVTPYAPDSTASSSVTVDELEATSSGTSSGNSSDDGLVINPTISSSKTDNKVDPPDDANSTGNSSYATVEQNFPEATKTDNTAPPDPPEIKDKTELTDSSKEPVYDPEQLEVKGETKTDTDTSTPSGTPQHGDRKDGKIYINGFGWIKEIGEGEGTYAADMYENGNKIGYFG